MGVRLVWFLPAAPKFSPLRVSLCPLLRPACVIIYNSAAKNKQKHKKKKKSAHQSKIWLTISTELGDHAAWIGHHASVAAWAMGMTTFSVTPPPQWELVLSPHHQGKSKNQAKQTKALTSPLPSCRPSFDCALTKHPNTTRSAPEIPFEFVLRICQNATSCHYYFKIRCVVGLN